MTTGIEGVWRSQQGAQTWRTARGPGASPWQLVHWLQRFAPSTTRLELLKFSVRLLCAPRLHRQWAAYLGASPQRQAWAQAQPALLWKLQRPYAVASSSARHTLQRLMDHYDWLEARWPAQVLDALRGGLPVTLASVDLPEGIRYHLRLSCEERFAKEGELALSLLREAQPLATLVFSVGRTEAGWSLHIGCVQGPSGGDAGREAVRHATKELEGLRPKQCVLQALYGIAALHDVHTVTGVSNEGHVYQGQRRREGRVQSDYDGFWTELGGVPNGEWFVLPSEWHVKPIEEVPSRKRAQYRRRREIEQALAHQVDTLLGAPACPPG